MNLGKFGHITITMFCVKEGLGVKEELH